MSVMLFSCKSASSATSCSLFSALGNFLKLFTKFLTSFADQFVNSCFNFLEGALAPDRVEVADMAPNVSSSLALSDDDE